MRGTGPHWAEGGGGGHPQNGHLQGHSKWHGYAQNPRWKITSVFVFKQDRNVGGGGMWDIMGMAVGEEKCTVSASVVKEGFLEEGEQVSP